MNMMSRKNSGSRSRKVKSPSPKVVIILGPTAAGKTALGINVAQALGGSVISADSRQVFAGLNIGTAKPKEAHYDEAHPITTPDVIEKVPHYLLNIATPTSHFSLAEWQPAALNIITERIAQSEQPVLVGGTMLYLDSIVYNYQIPEVPPNEALRETLESRPVAELWEQLITQDPDAATFIEPHHKRRIIRALEVIAVTNQPFSATRRKLPPLYPMVQIGIFPGWEQLEHNISARAKTMLKEGLLDEVRTLREKYGADLPLLRTINYQEAGALLDGQTTEPEAIKEMAKVNLRYAHRQMSWWKKRKEIIWLKEANAETALPVLS
jgi:tRNA dimethylallyltransferase